MVSLYVALKIQKITRIEDCSNYGKIIILREELIT